MRRFGILTKKHGIIIPLFLCSNENFTTVQNFKDAGLILDSTGKLIYGNFVASIVKNRIEALIAKVTAMAEYIVKHGFFYKMQEQQSAQFVELYQIYKTMWKTIEDEEQISSLSIENPFIEKKISLLKSFPAIIPSLTSLNIFFDVSDGCEVSRASDGVGSSRTKSDGFGGTWSD